MKAPVPIWILSEIAHGIAAAHQHVADIELQPHDGWIEPLDEDVIRHDAIERLHMIRLVVEREPDSCAPSDGSRGVEAIGPFAPVVQSARRISGE